MEADLLAPVDGLAALIGRGFSMRQIAALLALRERRRDTLAPCPARRRQAVRRLRRRDARSAAHRQARRRWPTS